MTRWKDKQCEFDRAAPLSSRDSRKSSPLKGTFPPKAIKQPPPQPHVFRQTTTTTSCPKGHGESIWAGLDEEALDLSLDGVDLALELARLVGGDGRGDDRA